MAATGIPKTDTSRNHWFVTTRWSVVLAARHGEDTRARAALETLCRAYWYPLYTFVRRLGHSPHDAEDLVQSFFERLLEKRSLKAADPAKGRFRSFLLVALKHFLANEWDRARAAKRGGGAAPLSLDGLPPEERYAKEPATDLSPDRLYDRRWALTLLERVMARLEAEQAQAGHRPLFAQLKQALTAPRTEVPHAVLANRLGMSEGAVKVAIHRLRQRYRVLLEEEIAHTVGSAGDAEAERRDLFSALSG